MKSTVKTFKIGEYAVGGIIKVEIIGKTIFIKTLDWFTKKVIDSGSISIIENNAYHEIYDYLNELTSFYYADKIINWIETKVKLN